MSKSRGNVVNPDDVVKAYGADTLRLYEMFMGPFENSMPWSETSLKGSSRFLVRVWNTLNRLKENIVETDTKEMNYAMHVAIKRVSEGTDQFKFNTAVAALMELLNVVEKESGVSKQLLETYVLLLSPYAPHIAEELWKKLGNSQSLMNQNWPKLDEDVLKQGVVNLPVQVNGKLRGEIEAVTKMTQEEAEKAARELENVAKYLKGKELVKVIYIEERMLNFVVK